MKYLKRFNENMALAKSIISKKMEAFDKLKELLKSNLGYIGKFTEYLMNENIPYAELEALYRDLVELKNKQKPIDIASLGYEQVVDKIKSSKNDLVINSLISQFPSEQKAIARELIKSNNGYNLLLKAANSEKKDILITKISRYHTTQELKTALTLLSKEAMNERDKIKEFLKESKSSIVYETDNTMIVKVDSLSDVQKLGSDTSWCILGQSMWTKYTSGRYQYILYDFTKDDWDPKFKIGFTLNKDFTVHAAHDILDSGCSSYLNEFMEKNNIKYSELIPKSELIEVTDQMISDIKKTTKVSVLTSYSDNIPKEKIPTFLKKLFDTSVDTRASRTFAGGIVLGDAKIEIVKNCLNKYFSDKSYVLPEELKEVDVRLYDMIGTLQNRNPGILKRKMVTKKPTFDPRTLNSDIIVKVLDQWSVDDLVESFSRDLDIFYVPGSGWKNNTDITFASDWNAEKLKVVSDKLNQIYTETDWKKSPFIVRNRNFSKGLIANYILFNYVLGRPQIVKKSTLNELSEDDKLKYAFVFKMPVDFSKCDYTPRYINQWSVPLIVKKDYDDKIIYIENLSNIIKLVDHLMGYKLKFKMSKTNFDRTLYNSRSIPDSEGKKLMIDLISKFKTRKRVGDIVRTEDEKISIELY